MKYRLIIFDLDGTILETLEDLADSTNAALKVNGFPQRSIDEVRSFVGNGIGKLIERAVPQGTDEQVTARVLEDFKAYYAIHCMDKTKPYDGIIDLLGKLRAQGCLTAVISNKADFAVQTLINKYFPGMFDLVAGEKAGIPRKPDPTGVFDVMRRLGVERKDTAYVGDSDVDIATAKNAGLDALIVSWGFRDRAFLIEHGAGHMAATPNELYAMCEG